MKTPKSVMEALAKLYEKSRAGETGQWTNDILVELDDLLGAADCHEGNARTLAERELRQHHGKLLQLEFLNKRDTSAIFQIRFSPTKERELYILLKRPSPTEKRQVLANLFIRAASDAIVPPQWRSPWETFCHNFAQAAANGDSLKPLDRNQPDEIHEILTLLPKLLAWPDKTEGSLVRFVSCLLCENSKRLEELASREKEGELEGKLRGRLGQLLEKITDKKIRTLDDLGILSNPRFALVHGPLRLKFGNEWLDLGLLHGPCRLSLQDIERAEKIETTARRCLTVENETCFHELAKLRSGELLIQTSYPGSATIAFLKELQGISEFWHFGDSDEDGFEILRVLGEKSGRNFQSLHMHPGRKHFEQESLGRPTQQIWPFYL